MAAAERPEALGGMEFIASLNAVDVAAVVFVLLNALLGLSRGLSGEMARVAGTIIALLAGMAAYEPLGEWLVNESRLEDRAAHAGAFIGAVLAALVVMIIMRHLLKRALEFVITERYDRILGTLAGILRGAVLVVIIFIAMLIIPNDYLNRTFGTESRVGTFIQEQVMALLEAGSDSPEESADSTEE